MKYKLTSEKIKYKGITLYRIQALVSFRDVMEGDLGGFVESVENLSQSKGCWIYDDAKVYGHAKVTGAAIVKDYAEIRGEASIRDSSKVLDNAFIDGRVIIKNSSIVMEDAKISGKIKLLGNSVVRGDVDLYSDSTQEYFSKIVGTEKYPLSRLVKDCIEEDELPKVTFAVNPNKDIIMDYKQALSSLLRLVDKIKGERDFIRNNYEDLYNQIEKLI